MMAMATIMTMTMTKVKEGKAVVSGTSTLIGSIATLLSSVQRFFRYVIYSRMIMMMIERMIMMMTMGVLIPCSLPCI